MSDQDNHNQPGAEVAVLDKALVAKFAQMATMIPSEDAGGMERIMEQILTAQSWEDLDAPWTVSKADQLAGRILRCSGVQRRPSDFREGMGFFLVLDCADTKTGEKMVVTTSATAIIGQIVLAYAKGWFPCFIEFVVAERPTERGYRPHHLKFHGVDVRQPANA
jgi:hypothetical protein